MCGLVYLQHSPSSDTLIVLFECLQHRHYHPSLINLPYLADDAANVMYWSSLRDFHSEMSILSAIYTFYPSGLVPDHHISYWAASTAWNILVVG
jgi:hypothetical protein